MSSNARTADVGYVCNIADDQLRTERHIDSDSPAALQKVVGVCSALQRVGLATTIFSAGRGRCHGTGRWFGGTVRSIGGQPVCFASGWDRAQLGRVVTSLSLSANVIRQSRRGSTLIFYNAQLDALPVLVFGRVLGRRCVLDVEDGIDWQASGTRSRLEQMLFRCFRTLSRSHGALVATASLASEVPAAPTVVVHGVVQEPNAVQNPIRRVHDGQGLAVLFGGSLLEETGVNLFIDALAELECAHPTAWQRLKFYVSGYGPLAGRLANAARERFAGHLFFLGRLSRPEYQQLVAQCQIGLSLKLPNTRMGQTTFPSKVLELANAGLLVVSTRVSDVPIVFPEGTAILLSEATPLALAEALAKLESVPGLVAQLALAGQKHVRSVASSEVVGWRLRRFLLETSQDNSFARNDVHGAKTRDGESTDSKRPHHNAT